MARLPDTLNVGGPRGARYSGASIGSTDLGLGDLAQGIEAVGKAVAERDGRKATKLLQDARAGYETGFAQRAAGYDGREPGFANFETSHFDAWAKGLTENPDLGEGVRLALKRQLDDYRANAGTRAIGVEAQARGEIIADQRRAQSAQNLSVGLTGFQAAYGEAFQGLANDYDGSTRDFTTRAGVIFDETAKAAAEAVPEADRADFMARLAGLRPSLQAQAFEHEQRASQAYLVESVKTARATTVNAVLGNPDAFGLAASTAEELLAGLPKPLRGPVLREYQGELAAARVQGLILKGDLETAAAELDSGQHDAVLTPAQKVQLTEAARGRSARLAADLIEALRVGGDVDVDAMKRAAVASGDPGLVAKADFAATVGAFEGEALSAFGSGTGGKKGFTEAAGFVIDTLEGGAAVNPNDNGRGASKFGFTQAFHPDIDVTKLTRPQALARARRYWNAVGGDSLPPGLAVAAFDAAFNQGPEKARTWLAESGGDVGAFMALREAEYRRLAKADPAKYGDDLPGWLNRLGKVTKEAARRQAFENVQEGLASDPIKFALGGSGRAPLANVPALPQEPAGPAFQTALQGRLAVGEMMSRTRQVPLRMLTDGEAAYFKDRIDRDPTQAVDFAREALAAVGPRAARSLLGEIGRQGEAGVTLHLADLTAAGLESFADRAARGLALRKQGTELEKIRRDGIKGELEAVKSVFAGMPELRLSAQAAAEAAMLADMQAGEPKSASYYVAGALGASTRKGRLYGGVARVNGQDTLLPTWLANDRADEALDIMAAAWAATGRGPVHTDGTRVSEQTLRYQARLQMRPDGRYLLIDGKGRAYATPDGRPFAFDWDDARDGLAARLGSAGVLK